MSAAKLIPSPLNPDWLIPQGWENILGVNIDYRLGGSVLHLWRVQFNQHASLAGLAAPHAHPHHQLLYYQRGRGRLEANGQRFEVEKGSVFFVPTDCRHHFQNAARRAGKTGPEETPICLALDFAIEKTGALDLGGLPMESEVAVLLSLLHAERARPFQLQPIDQLAVDGCIAEMVAENQKRELGYASLIQSLLLRLIALCLRATRRAHGFGEHFRHTAWRYGLLADQVAERIREDYARVPELTLGEVARKCGASANHLNRILKKQTGRTFHQLLLGERLRRARELLERGKLNCTEAALESGFHDSNYFSRVFRKTHGYPPSRISRKTS